MKHRITRNTLTVFSANILQAALGFSVSAFVAAVFGNAAEVDAFFIAAPIPILIGQFTLSISLVALTPYYQRLCETDGHERALMTIAPLFWTWCAIVVVIGAVGFFLTKPLAQTLAPGFKSERLALLVTYLRWSFLATPFISVSGLMQALENADGHFFRPAFVRPLITAMSLGAVITFFTNNGLEPFFVGMFSGAVLGAIWQFLEVRSFGPFPVSLRGVGQIWRAVRGPALSMALARSIGQGAELGLQMIASLAAVGVVAIYGFSFKIAAIPLMLSISLALALFPAQSAALARNNVAESLRILWRGVNALTILGAFFGAFFFVWAEPLVILLYERGDFNPTLTAQAAQTIRVFSLGLMVIAANNAIANGFWAARRMKERITLEAVSIVILLSVAALTITKLGATGLAVAYVADYTFLFFVGLWLLEKDEAPAGSRLSAYFKRLATFAKVSIVTILSIGLGALLAPSGQFFRGLDMTARFGLLAAEALGFTIFFFTGLYLAKVSEARDLIHKVVSRFARASNPSVAITATTKSTKAKSAKLDNQPAGVE